MAEKNQVAVRFEEYLSDSINNVTDALPKDFNKARFVQNCIALREDTPELKSFNNAKELVNGLLKGCYMGLDFFKKECYLIPRGNKLVFQTDYKGEIKFVKQFSTRPIRDIYAKVVRQGDDFKEEIKDGIPTVSYSPLPFNGGDIIGAFAVCLFEDDGMLYETMSLADINAVRNNYSSCANSKAWKNSFDEMAKKTVLRRLCKHIDTNIDSVEAMKAYEEGSGMEFNNAPERGEVNSNPFEKKEEEIVVESVDVTPSEDDLPDFMR